jgi:hypothetical protein
MTKDTMNGEESDRISALILYKQSRDIKSDLIQISAVASYVNIR